MSDNDQSDARLKLIAILSHVFSPRYATLSVRAIDFHEAHTFSTCVMYKEAIDRF